MRRADQKNFGVNINEELADRFSEQIDERGQKKFRAIEGAIKLWLNLPSEVQAQLISNSELELESVYEGLGNRLREALHNALLHEIQSQKTKEEGGSKGRKSPK